MAQVISYWDKDIEYKEGPFVYCSAGFICVEKQNKRIPAKPHYTIDLLIKTASQQSMLEIVDWLNSKVGEKIILAGGEYICEDFLKEEPDNI